MAAFNTAQRNKLAAQQEAMPGGRYPIRNAKDLENAFKDWVRTGRPTDVAAWIHKRAKQLGLPDPIKSKPDSEGAGDKKGPADEPETYDTLIQRAATRATKKG